MAPVESLDVTFSTKVQTFPNFSRPTRKSPQNAHQTKVSILAIASVPTFILSSIDFSFNAKAPDRQRRWAAAAAGATLQAPDHHIS